MWRAQRRGWCQSPGGRGWKPRLGRRWWGPVCTSVPLSSILCACLSFPSYFQGHMCWWWLLLICQHMCGHHSLSAHSVCGPVLSIPHSVPFLLTWLSPCWPPHHPFSSPGMLPVKSFCTGYSLCLTCSSLMWRPGHNVGAWEGFATSEWWACRKLNEGRGKDLAPTHWLLQKLGDYLNLFCFNFLLSS